MNAHKISAYLLLLSLALACHVAADEPQPRIWVLPFQNPSGGAALTHLEEALPALLAVLVSQSPYYTVVDRVHLDQVLAEQSLTLQGLTTQPTRHTVGRLLGASLIISGRVAKQGQQLHISSRAFDVETGAVIATAQATGPFAQLAQLVMTLYQRLTKDLDHHLPGVQGAEIDATPVSNLHFMRGLGHYYSAQYNQAIAEFMAAARETTRASQARLWVANAYLAQGQYQHAYLELRRLRGTTIGFKTNDISAKLRACERHLSAAEIEMIQALVARQATASDE